MSVESETDAFVQEKTLIPTRSLIAVARSEPS